MAYEVVMPYHLHMPSYFLETFTEYPFFISCKASTFPVPKLLKIHTFASHKKKLNSL